MRRKADYNKPFHETIDEDGTVVVLNGAGEILDLLYLDGRTVKCTYDDYGNLLAYDDRDGDLRDFRCWSHDRKGRITYSGNSKGEKHFYTYYRNGKVKTHVDEAGMLTIYPR